MCELLELICEWFTLHAILHEVRSPTLCTMHVHTYKCTVCLSVHNTMWHLHSGNEQFSQDFQFVDKMSSASSVSFMKIFFPCVWFNRIVLYSFLIRPVRRKIAIFISSIILIARHVSNHFYESLISWRMTFLYSCSGSSTTSFHFFVKFSRPTPFCCNNRHSNDQFPRMLCDMRVFHWIKKTWFNKTSLVRSSINYVSISL